MTASGSLPRGSSCRIPSRLLGAPSGSQVVGRAPQSAGLLVVLVARYRGLQLLQQVGQRVVEILSGVLVVVPPSQAEMFRDALVRKQIPHAYRAYEGESHGFRRSSTIIDARDSELSFYGLVMGFERPAYPSCRSGGPVPAAGSSRPTGPGRTPLGETGLVELGR